MDGEKSLIVKAKNWIKNNSIFIILLSIVIFFQFIYILNSSINVPAMDYWRYINKYVEKCFNGGVTFNELYESYAGHKSLITTLLFVINVATFGFNSRISTVFAIVIMSITSIIIYKLFISNINSLKLNKENDLFNIVKQVLGVLIIFPIFNLNQWEILLLEFATPFTIRILITIGIFYMSDKVMLYNDKIKLIPYMLSLILSVNLVFAGYSAAVVVTIIAILFLNIILNKGKVNAKLSAAVFFTIIFSMLLYLHGSTVSVGVKHSLKDIILNLPKGFLVLMGSSILHEDLAKEYIGFKTYYLVGLVIILFYILAVFIYFKYKYFKVTYIPIMLICYTLVNMGCIYISRFSDFGLNGMTASRYTVDTTIGLIGVVFILSLWSLKYLLKVNTLILKKFLFCLLPILLITTCLIKTNCKEHYIGSYRCDYYRDLIFTMENIENYKDEELGKFQANSTEMVRKGVELMKKYKLGVFH